MARQIQLIIVTLMAILVMAWGSTTPVSAKTPDTPAGGSPMVETSMTGGGWCC
jgi:hypothetical protein